MPASSSDPLSTVALETLAELAAVAPENIPQEAHKPIAAACRSLTGAHKI